MELVEIASIHDACNSEIELLDLMLQDTLSLLEVTETIAFLQSVLIFLLFMLLS